MAEGTLASAVIVPEQEPVIPSPDAGLKRRQSSISDPDPENKRRRFSSQDENNNPQTAQDHKQTSPGAAEQKPDRKPVRQPRGRDDERKRGQRLFGGLLGTLSQSSTSAAQKRRADIERKQQEKLRQQDDEYDELKKKKRDERATIRKKEQRLYEEESMHTRHSNLVAMAHFLKTKTEPVLYYKPWQLRPDDEAIIREQIEDAEATVAREVAEFAANHPPQEHDSKDQTESTPEEKPEPATVPAAETEETKDTAQEAQGTVEAETNHDRNTDVAQPVAAPTHDNHVPVHNGQPDVHRGAEDDGGEVVEDMEDTVIY